MPCISSVSTALVIRRPDGTEIIAAACFPHPRGLLYLDLFWHQSTPDKSAYIIHGELTGDGPWKVNDAVIRLIGCQHTDPDLQDELGHWMAYLRDHPEDYPPRTQIVEIARRLGASPAHL